MTEITSKDREMLLNKFITKAIAGTICCIMLGLTTCTIHMNSYNPEEAKGAAVLAAANIDVAKQEQAAEMERLKVMERLIKEEKIDPIAARCAVKGWGAVSSEVCLEIAKGKAPTPTVTEEAK